MSASRLIDQTLAELSAIGFEQNLARESYTPIIAAGFNRRSLKAAFVLAQLAHEHQPTTVRGLMYRAQAAGLFSSPSQQSYDQTARIILKLRRVGIIPYSWIVDSTRRRLKPSSWADLSDFAEDAARCYRLDFWSRQSHYIEFFVEKDAMAGILEPVTSEYDVYLNVVRGQPSETFVWNIAEQWNEIEKPIFAYYLGDHDPSGLEIEASLKSKLYRFSDNHFRWRRLAITMEDFANPELLGFPVKRTAGGWRDYLQTHGDRCVEIDALSSSEVRQRISDTIESHIDGEEWETLKRIEQRERETLKETMLSIA
jgi:hypothetical protein